MSAACFDGPIYTREGIVAALRDFELEHGVPPTRKAWDEHRAGREPTSRTVMRYFQTWNAALAAAGMDPNRRHRCRECVCIDTPGHGGACICTCGEMPSRPCRTVR